MKTSERPTLGELTTEEMMRVAKGITWKELLLRKLPTFQWWLRFLVVHKDNRRNSGLTAEAEAEFSTVVPDLLREAHRITTERDYLLVVIDRLTSELEASRDTNTRLNRRVTQAEAANSVTVEECRREGVPLGRSLANAECNRLIYINAVMTAQLAEQAAEIDKLKAGLK